MFSTFYGLGAVPKQLEALEKHTCTRFHQRWEFSELTPTPTKMRTLFGVYAGVILIIAVWQRCLIWEARVQCQVCFK